MHKNKSNEKVTLNLDYSIKTKEGRKAAVDKICAQGGYFTHAQLERMSDYLLFTTEKGQTKKMRKEEYQYSTNNRDATVKKRTASFDALLDSMHDDAYLFLFEGDAVRKLDSKARITTEDLRLYPQIAERWNTIQNIKKQYDRATGSNKYSLGLQIIQEYKTMYEIKRAQMSAVKARINQQLTTITHMQLPEEVQIDKDSVPQSNSFLTTFNEKHISFLLKYYQKLKQESWEDLDSDLRWILIDLEDTVDKALADYPLLYRLLVLKIDGVSGKKIAEMLAEEFGEVHSQQYYSTIWRNRIPKLIKQQRQKDYISWYYANHYGTSDSNHWKTCRKCHYKMPAHPLFFDKNSDNKFYSRCKKCRTKS